MKSKSASMECRCEVPEELVARSSVPVVFDEKLNEYHLEFQENNEPGHYILNYCPFCGSHLAKSLRNTLFTDIPEEEYQRIKEITDKINSIEDAVEIHGEPVRERRVVWYDSFSEVATVGIYESKGEKGTMIFPKSRDVT